MVSRTNLIATTTLSAALLLTGCSSTPASPDATTLRPWFDKYITLTSDKNTQELAKHADDKVEVAQKVVELYGQNRWTVQDYSQTNPTETMYVINANLKAPDGKTKKVEATAIWSEGHWKGSIVDPALPKATGGASTVSPTTKK